MAHRFSSGVCVKVPSWHRLENAVLEAGDAATKNVERFMELAKQNWTVSHESICFPDGTPATQVIEYADGTTENRDVGKIVRRGDTGACLGVVGPKTHILQNVEAFAPLQPYLDSGLLTLETAGCLDGGARVWMLAKINKNNFVVQPGDEIEKYFLCANSHDGTLAARFGLTATRVVCNNTLSSAIFDKEAKKDIVKIRHSSKVQMKAADAIANIESLNNAMDNGFASLAALAKVSISVSKARQYFKDVFNMPEENVPKQSRDLLDELTLKYENNVALVRELLDSHNQRTAIEAQAQEIVGSQVLDAILTEKMETGIGQTQGRETWWSAYNAVTEYLTHDRGRNEETRFASLFYGDSAKKNEYAFELAMKGANLA